MNCRKSYICRLARRMVRTLLHWATAGVPQFTSPASRSVDGMSRQEIDREMARIENEVEKFIDLEQYSIASLIDHRLRMDRYEALQREWLRRENLHHIERINA